MIYKISDPESMGKIPVRQEIEVLSADDTKDLKIGWIVYERVGVGIVNSRAFTYNVFDCGFL